MNIDESEEFAFEDAIEEVDTLIVSDIHLGSEVSRSKQLLDIIKQFHFKRLILNGDVFDDLNFKRLSKSDWKFLSYIRKISGHKIDSQVTWVIGNHDGVAEILSHLLGIEVLEEYVWEFENKKYLALHGHQFDSFITENARLTDIASYLYLLLQKVDFEQQQWARDLHNQGAGRTRWQSRHFYFFNGLGPCRNGHSCNK